MKRLNFTVLIFLGVFSSGCAVKQAMNAEEFRKMAPESMFGKTKTVEVKQPLFKIARAFQAKAPKCLDITLKRSSCVSTGYGGTSCSTSLMDYNPTVKVSKQRVELHLQMNMENAITFSKIPKGGIYTMVVDAEPISKNKSRLKFYYGSFGADTIVSAVTGWAAGTTKGCPDLTQ